jgi:hypothetical protein
LNKLTCAEAKERSMLINLKNMVEGNKNLLEPAFEEALGLCNNAILDAEDAYFSKNGYSRPLYPTRSELIKL